MQQRDGIWSTTVEVTAASHADLIKREAAVRRLLAKLDKDPAKPRRSRGEGALYKRSRDGMWVGQVDLEPGPDGDRRKSKPVYSKDKATAVAKLNKLKEDLAKGMEPVDKRITVEKWLNTWIEEIAKPHLDPHTYAGYKSSIKNQIIPHIGKRRLATLKPEHVRHLHKAILASTYTRRGEEHHYTTRTVEAAHNVLSKALNDAITEELVHRNVCELAQKPGVVSKSAGALSSEAARKLLLTAQAANDPLVTRWAAGMMLGGRQGEILGLQWERVDLDRGMLDLSWQLKWPKLKPEHKKDPVADDRFDVPPGFEIIPLWRSAALMRPKTERSKRMVPLPEPLAAILSVYKETAAPNPWDLVWTWPTGGERKQPPVVPISDSRDRSAWSDALSRAGLEQINVRAMRDTTATLLMEAGVDARIIQEILGHTSVLTTRGYQHVDLKQAKKALGNLNALLPS